MGGMAKLIATVVLAGAAAFAAGCGGNDSNGTSAGPVTLRVR
jgi:hypothetical protein